MTTTLLTVPTPGRWRSGTQSSRTRAPTTIETVPSEPPTVPADALVQHVPRHDAEPGPHQQRHRQAVQRQPERRAGPAGGPCQRAPRRTTPAGPAAGAGDGWQLRRRGGGRWPPRGRRPRRRRTCDQDARRLDWCQQANRGRVAGVTTIPADRLRTLVGDLTRRAPAALRRPGRPGCGCWSPTGGCRSAARLPAERDLAAALHLSRATVAAAYGRLREQGWADARQGSGTWTRLPASHPRLAGRVAAGAGRGRVWSTWPTPRRRRRRRCPPPSPRRSTTCPGCCPATATSPRACPSCGPGSPSGTRAAACPRPPEQVLVTSGALHGGGGRARGAHPARRPGAGRAPDLPQRAGRRARRRPSAGPGRRRPGRPGRDRPGPDQGRAPRPAGAGVRHAGLPEPHRAAARRPAPAPAGRRPAAGRDRGAGRRDAGRPRPRPGRGRRRPGAVRRGRRRPRAGVRRGAGGHRRVAEQERLGRAAHRLAAGRRRGRPAAGRGSSGRASSPGRCSSSSPRATCWSGSRRSSPYAAQSCAVAATSSRLRSPSTCPTGRCRCPPAGWCCGAGCPAGPRPRWSARRPSAGCCWRRGRGSAPARPSTTGCGCPSPSRRTVLAPAVAVLAQAAADVPHRPAADPGQALVV